MGHNEMLLAEGLRGWRDRAFIQVKFGAQRGPEGAFLWINARPAAVRTALAYSLRRLGTDHVDLYQTGLDPAVPVEDTIGAIADLVGQGYVRYVGITNVDAATLRRAHAAFPITALQTEYGLMSRDIEGEVLPTCRALGIGVTAYGVLGRGLLTRSAGQREGDVRSKPWHPRCGYRLTCFWRSKMRFRGMRSMEAARWTRVREQETNAGLRCQTRCLLISTDRTLVSGDRA